MLQRSPDNQKVRGTAVESMLTSLEKLEADEVVVERAASLAEYGLDEKLKKLLATKCSGEHAPDGLKNRLRQSIREIVLESAEVTVESGPEGTVVEVRTTRLEQTF